jgi:HK97 family phage prohead protease
MLLMKMELRVNPTSITSNDDGTMTVSGYVNKTESRSNMLGKDQKFIEVIKKGAWQRAIDKAGEVHFLAEHDKSKILSSTRNGSLELREDDEGLFMSATISPTSWGKDYYTLIKDGILQNMSFGFRAVKDAWRNLGTYFERTVDELELFEVSVVRDPAYANSSISARGIDLVEDEVPASELNLRTIEIRSDDDIQAIATKLFEMLQGNLKVAEGVKDKEELEDLEEDEKIKEEEDLKPEDNFGEEKQEKVEDEKEEDSKVDDKETEEETDDNKQPDAVDKPEEEKAEEVEDKEEEKEEDVTGKIRDFINQYKQS